MGFGEIAGVALKHGRCADPNMNPSASNQIRGRILQAHGERIKLKNPGDLEKIAKADEYINKGKDLLKPVEKTVEEVAENPSLLGKILAPIGKLTEKIPGPVKKLAGPLLSIAFAVPNVIKAFKDYGAGEGFKQIGREALKIGGGLLADAVMAVETVGGTTVGVAIGAAIGQVLIPIPGVGAIIGGALGGVISTGIELAVMSGANWLGTKTGEMAGNMIFGKAKIEQEAAAQQNPAEISANNIDPTASVNSGYIDPTTSAYMPSAGPAFSGYPNTAVTGQRLNMVSTGYGYSDYKVTSDDYKYADKMASGITRPNSAY